jgi:hypothetical protein
MIFSVGTFAHPLTPEQRKEQKEALTKAAKESKKTQDAMFPRLSIERKAVAMQVLAFAEHDPLVLARVVGIAGFSQSDLSLYLMNKYKGTKWAVSKDEAEMVKAEVVKEFDGLLGRRYAKGKLNCERR